MFNKCEPYFLFNSKNEENKLILFTRSVLIQPFTQIMYLFVMEILIPCRLSPICIENILYQEILRTFSPLDKIH